MNKGLFIKKILCLLLISFGITAFSAFEAEATHFRYGNITWKRVPGNNNQIEFKISQSWRRSFYSNPSIGAIINTGYAFNTGIGNIPLDVTVTSVNVSEDWFYGEKTVIINYPGPGTYQAGFMNCCRISNLSNNGDREFNIRTTVTVGNANDAPITTMTPFINLPVGLTNATYQIPTTDPNGDSISYSMTPNGQFGSGTVQPAGISVSPTGLITFNTVGRPINSLHNASITISDSKGAVTVVDFIIRVTPPSTPPAYNYTITPNNNFTYIVAPGSPVNFNLNASDADQGQTVTINGVGLPVGSVFSNVVGNPGTASFSWTPSLSNLGTYLLNFTATDNVGASTNTIVQIIVTADPSFSAPTPGNNSIFCTVPGNMLQWNYFASDPDTTDIVTIDATNGVQPGMVFSPALPVVQTAAASTQFTWTPTAAQWGLHLLTLRATDQYGGYTENTAHIIVNNPPNITSTPPLTVNAGTTYTYVLTTEDLDLPYGDEVSIESYSLPAFLTLTDNMDGTYTISGSPTLADVGTHPVMIEIQDSMNHYNSTHCGHDYQIFNLEVLPCDLTTTITSAPVNNLPNHPSNIIYLGYGNQSATLTASTNGFGNISYNWSNGGSTASIVVSPTSTTTYEVIIEDANGCKDTATYTVTVVDVRCGNKNDKVRICHKTGNGYHELCVAAPAVAAHLAHGDYLGNCVNSVSGHLALETDVTMSIYPNPSNDFTTLNLNVPPVNATVNIYDATGRLILTQAITAISTQITTDNLAAGWYMVEYKDEGVTLRDKLIKQ